VTSESIQGNAILMTATVPASAALDTLYNFTCTINGMSVSQPNAIDVVSSFLNNYEFGILTDVHINNDSAADFNRTCWNLEHALSELELNGVQFIVVTGDLTEGDRVDEMQTFYNIMATSTVPAYIILGNHEQYYPALYEQYFGSLDFTFNYGPNNLFIAFDSGMLFNQISPTTLDWLTNNLQANQNVPNIFLAFHTPSFYIEPNNNFELNRPEFATLCQQYNVKACFFGHLHKDGIFMLNGTDLPLSSSYTGTKLIMTSDCRDVGAYRVLSMVNNQLANYTVQNSTTTRDNILSDRAGSLNVDYLTPNDGNQTVVNATLFNLHPYETYNTLTVPFTMKFAGQGTPTTSSFNVTTNGSSAASIGSVRQFAANPQECTVDVILQNVPVNCSISIGVTEN
jgi:hypothetical protein